MMKFSHFKNNFLLIGILSILFFGLCYHVALAVAPDPDSCGWEDSVFCTNPGQSAIISWNPSFPTFALNNNWKNGNLTAYILTVQGVGSFNAGLNTSYTVPGLKNSTTYNWSVEAQYFVSDCFADWAGTTCSYYYSLSAPLGAISQPYGSFTTRNCAPPTVDLLVNNSPGPVNLTATSEIFTLNWTSNNADACHFIKSDGTRGASRPVAGILTTCSVIGCNLATPIKIECDGPGGTASDQVVVNIVAPACNSGADCNDGNSCTTDTCLNPGTPGASCSNTSVGCVAGDTCCPAGCTNPPDTDCAAPPAVITITVTGPGTVTAPPGTGDGINCGKGNTNCDESYTVGGPDVTLTPSPDTGYTYTWSGDPDCSDGKITPNASKICTITFTPTTPTLTVTVTGPGTVSSNPSGINNCSGTCSNNFTYGTVVTLTETPGTDAQFSGWSGSCSGAGTSVNVTVDSAKTCTATFVALTQSVTLAAINPSPDGKYAPQNNVDLKATVTGNVSGTINYAFYCNCNNSTLNTANSGPCGNPDLKVNNSNTNPYTAADLCNYSTAGTYYPKVIIERGPASMTKESHFPVTVLNNAPTASIPAGDPGSMTNINYCVNSPIAISLNWNFSDPDPGDSQTAYRLRITRKRDGQVCDTNKQAGTVSSRSALYINNACPNFIWYDLTGLGYDWYVWVWDKSDQVSAQSNLGHFTTPLHKCPDAIDFTWLPNNPGAGEEAEFTATAACYDSDNKCNSYTWDFGDGTAPVTTTGPTVTHTFPDKKTYTIKLEVKDGDGYICSATKDIDVKWKLPSWTEILPF